MLPSSASTTSNLAVTGVSGTVENRPARQVKLRNTRDQARIGAVFAFPLQWGTINLGVLDLYRRAPGSLSAAQVRDAISAADAAALMLLGRRTGPDPDGDVGWDRSWSKRAEIHQATGMVVAQLGISPTDAFARLRAHAFTQGVALGDVARDVVARRLRFDGEPDGHGQQTRDPR